MDATDEFRYIAPAKESKRRCSEQSSQQDDRNVPVCVTNSGKNVKLRFMWDKAFKLFQSNRPVYRAVSGVNYQDYRTGGSSLPTGALPGSLGYPSRSLSHSHLNRLVMDSVPGSSNELIPHLRSYKKNRSEEQVSVIVPKQQQQQQREKKRSSLHVVEGVSEALGSSRGAGGSGGSKKKTKNKRPVSISGGEKPEGDDEEEDGGGGARRSSIAYTNANSTGNIHCSETETNRTTAVQLRRSQSTKSTGCHSSRSDGNRSYHFYETDNHYYCYPASSSYGSRETSPYPDKIVSKVDIITGGQCGSSGRQSSNGDYYNTVEDLYGHDSGLDTWKTPTHRVDKSNNNTEKSSGSGGGGHSAIVCTISTKIPSDPSSSSSSTKSQKDGSISRGDSSEKMDQKNNQQQQRLNGPRTTVVLISESNPVTSGDSNTAVQEHGNKDDIKKCEDIPTSGFFSDYECMSEIDLNSDTASSIGEDETPQRKTTNGVERKPHHPQRTSSSSQVHINGDKMRFINGHPLLRISSYEPTSLQSLENELDSLDLTLFETGRGGEKERTFLEAVRELDYDCLDNDDDDDQDPLYDTVTESDPSSTHTRNNNNNNNNNKENIYWNWSDAGSEFEFIMTPSKILNRDIPLGHSPRGQHPEIEWEPYFCVLNQLDQTFTAYRSEEMSIFPGTPTRPRTQAVFSENGISPTEVPRVRLDGGPNSVKCLINNSKWGMNPVMEEEEESSPSTQGCKTPAGTTSDKDKNKSADSSSSGSNNQLLRNSTPGSPLDTSYDKACGSEQRRSSAPLTPLLGGRETPSRFANFFSKRSFKSNPLKRTKSVTKLERKKPAGNEPESNNLYPSRLRTSRSHESLLAWTNNPHALNNFVNNGMMSTVDLTAGDVLIRTLHPSILGQDYAFQVITPSGSKYYSCSSGPERDAWVHALRQAIKPHSDEVRRQESSLKLWILEAKGVGGGSGKHSKRYFCELYLDDVLYARTCAKPRGEMLFWGEHFEFSQLPNCVQLITVVFFREGDKKRKKERNTCIGKVKIPVSSVNSRSLIEKWYPVVPDSGSNQTLNSKDKDGPSLRIKCKFQSVDILPLRCYRAFLQYVKDEYGPVSESLETVLSVKAKEDLASAMVHVLHHEGLAKEFIAELALQEILKSGDEKLTFRGNSIATKAMEAFLKLTGTEYLHATLGSFIEQFQNAEDVDCEIDPMKLPTASSNTLNKNQQNLRMAIETVWKSILHSHSMFPLELRECFAHCREALKSAGKEDLSDHLISASIFLRFLCPAILSPSLFNITNEYPTEKSARNLTLVAKILQTLANFTRFQGKENYMEFINDFVEREAPNMKLFLARISSPLSAEAVKKLQKENRDKVPAGGFIDLGKYLSILSTLLSESVAKIAPKNDRFKQLQEILESIHLWLKQPANATNVSMFPFPHLTSPPPTVPPPPAPIGIHLNHPHRASHPVNHQYQVPHQNNNNNNNNNPSTPQPIYAVTNVIHNNSNPNVKNISEVHIPPLQLQIPPVNNVLGLNNCINNNNQRSGSQASSGYQSQSPVLEGCEDKSVKSQVENNGVVSNINNNKNQYRKDAGDGNQVSFNQNTSFSISRKSGSQSVDDLSSLGVEPEKNLGFKKRLTRSSSSSDCEYTPTSVHSKGKSRSSVKGFSHHNALVTPGQGGKSKTKMVPTPHHRLSRRSSAELLRKNHPYSSSTDDDSDSGHHNASERDDSLCVPQLPPRRTHGNSKRNSGNVRPNPDGSLSSNGDKSLEEYEREMLELRRAMEALQVKLNRAEERLFGHDTSNQGGRRDSDVFIPSAPSPNGGSGSQSGGSGNGTRDRMSLKSADENSVEMDHLLQRLLSAEEEMKREQELLSALDRKQKLIEAQEQKIARLDAVNNQLLEALAQIRDSLQQQHVLAQQQKIQMQLQKQQQHLQSLSNGIHPLPASPSNRSFGSNNHSNKLQSNHYSLHCNNNNNNHLNGCVNNNGNSNGSYLNGPSSPLLSGQPQVTTPRHNNTTKVLITSDSSGDSGSVSPIMSLEISAQDATNGNNPRDSATFLGEQALKMLAELKSSSC